MNADHRPDERRHHSLHREPRSRRLSTRGRARQFSLQRRSRARAARTPHLGNLQLRRAVDRHEREHSHLPARQRHDRGRHELEAGDLHGVSGKRAGADSHAAERPRRRGVRHSVSGFCALGVRRAGRERAGDAAGAGGLRLVRHSDVDRRRSDLRDDRGARARHGRMRQLGRAGVLPVFLAAQRAGDRARHQDDPLSAGRHRAVSAVDRAGAAAVGAREGGRFRADAGDAFEIPNVRRVFPVFCSVADRRRGVLVHGGAEYSRLHAVRAQPARRRWWARRWACRRR